MSPRRTLYVRLVMVVAVVLAALFAIRGVASAAQPEHPTAAEHSVTAAPTEGDDENDVGLAGAPPSTDASAYGTFLRAALEKARGHVVAKLEAKMIASQEKTMGRLSAALFLFSLLGIGLVFRPLFLLTKYPGRAKTLIGYGFVSGGLFFVTVNLFAAVLGLLRSAQGACGHLTNPQIAVVEAAFDILDHRADDLAQMAPKLIEPSLHQLSQGDASIVVVLLENLKGVSGDISAVIAIAKAMKGLEGVFAYIPILLTLVALVTFATSAKDTLLAIVRLPETVAAGGGAGSVVKGVLRRVKGELFSTLLLIVFLIVLSIASGMALRAAVLPAVESFLSTVFLAFMYIQSAKVSSAVLFGSLALAAMVLVLNMAVVLAATSATLGKLHKIFQRKFHDGVPLAAHARFWKRAPLALAVCFLFPLAYDFVSEKLVEMLLAHELEAPHPSFELALVGSPAILVGGFVILFAAVFGVHALLFLFRYPVKTIGAPAVSVAAEPQPAQDAPDELAIFDRLIRARPAPTSMPPPPDATIRTDVTQFDTSRRA